MTSHGAETSPENLVIFTDRVAAATQRVQKKRLRAKHSRDKQKLESEAKHVVNRRLL